MRKLIKIVCVLIALLGALPWLLMAGFSPALFDSAATMSKAQKLLGGALVAVIWLVPVWVAYFGWQTIKNWRDGGAGSAVLMTLPALAIIGFVLAVNFGSFAP